MTVTVVDHTHYCANPSCRIPLRLSRSVAQGGCCCCRGDHSPDRFIDAPDVVATLPVVSGNQRDRAGLLGGFVSHPRDVA